MVEGYRKLEVWKKGYLLTRKIYEATECFPKEEMYGLVSQMRRASVSIAANIAEGYGRNHLGEYIQFVSYAIGSSNELKVYLLLSNDLKYLDDGLHTDLTSIHKEVSKMLLGLRTSLENKKTFGTSPVP